MIFWSCRKNGLIKEQRLISKFMTWQPGSQTIAMHKLPNISRSKGNQWNLKFVQLIEYNQGNIFLQKSCRKWSRETLVELYKSFLKWPWLMFVVLKILDNHFSMQNSWNASNCWRKRNFENCPTWLYLYFKCFFQNLGFILPSFQ